MVCKSKSAGMKSSYFWYTHNICFQNKEWVYVRYFLFQFGSPEAFYVSIPMMLTAFLFAVFYKPITYRYTLVDVFASRMESTRPWFLYVLDF